MQLTFVTAVLLFCSILHKHIGAFDKVWHEFNTSDNSHFQFLITDVLSSHTKLHFTLFCVTSGVSHTLSPVNSPILQQWNFLNLFQNGTDVSTVESWIMLENNDTLV